MESAAKRKAASGATTENDARPAKRQKVPVSATPISARGVWKAVRRHGGQDDGDALRGCCGMALDEQRDTYHGRPAAPPPPPPIPLHRPRRAPKDHRTLTAMDISTGRMSIANDAGSCTERRKCHGRDSGVDDDHGPEVP